jgi:uncharacterized membrane protein
MGNPFWNHYQQGKLKFAAAGLAAAIPSGVVFFLLYEVLGMREFWIWYTSGFLFYTIFVFGYAYIDDDATLFSDKDSRSKSKLIGVHLSYLCALFLVVQTAEYLKPHLPASMLSESRKGSSWFEVIVFVAMAIVFFVEEDWLKAEEQKPDSEGA